MAFYFVDQPFLAMESAFPSPRFCRQQRSPCHQRRQQCRRMPSYANSMDQLMEEARRQVLLEQNRTSEALAMQNFLGVMNGIVDSFLKGDHKNETEVVGERKSNSENETSASASIGESNQDNVPKNDDTKESNSKQKCSHPGALKDYFAAIDAIVNAMSDKKQRKTDEEENSAENGNSTPEKTADEEQNNNNFGEEKQPMKDFLNVMDTIVGKLMTHHHNENSISEEKNLRQTEVVVDKLSAGGNVDDNNVDQTIKIKTPTEAKNDEPPKKEQVFNSTENEVAQEVLKNQPRSSIQQVSQQKRLLTQVHVDENLDRVQIQIEFSGYDLKPENLDVQVVNNDILLVKAEKNDQKIFERKFKLSAKCQLDNIQPKFNDGGVADENSEQEEDSNITQTLNILVPKVDVKKTVNIPINTTSTTEE